MELTFKITPDAPNNESGLSQNDNDGKIHSSNMGYYYIPKNCHVHFALLKTLNVFSIFSSLECFPWKLLSYCTGPRNVLSYCTGPRKHVPGGTNFASWSPFKNIWQPFCFKYTSAEQTAKLENLQNASHNKYTKLHLKIKYL